MAKKRSESFNPEEGYSARVWITFMVEQHVWEVGSTGPAEFTIRRPIIQSSMTVEKQLQHLPSIGDEGVLTVWIDGSPSVTVVRVMKVTGRTPVKVQYESINGIHSLAAEAAVAMLAEFNKATVHYIDTSESARRIPSQRVTAASKSEDKAAAKLFKVLVGREPSKEEVEQITCW